MTNAAANSIRRCSCINKLPAPKEVMMLLGLNHECRSVEVRARPKAHLDGFHIGIRNEIALSAQSGPRHRDPKSVDLDGLLPPAQRSAPREQRHEYDGKYQPCHP